MSAAPAQPVNHGKPQFLRTLLRCYACLLPYKRIVTGAYTSVIIINGLNMVIPQIIRLTIDKGIDAGDIPQVGQYVILLPWSKGCLFIFKESGLRSLRKM
jgi:ABC-type multidrug transport system fused ATPase/permease subunit